MWLLLACREPEPARPADRGPPTTATDTGDSAEPGLHTGSADHTGDSGSPPSLRPEFCDTFPFTVLSQQRYAIQTTDDFDFDPEGRLVYVDWSGNYTGATIDGTTSVLSAGDPFALASAVQVLSTGSTAISLINQDKIIAANPADGARTDLLVGPNGPFALEVQDGDVIYFVDSWNGWISRVFTVNGVVEVVSKDFVWPLGLTLSPDQQTMYVTDSSGVSRMDYDSATGGWVDKRRVFNPPFGEYYRAMETDECGNLYSLEFYTGRVYRFDPYLDQVQLVAELENADEYQWSSMRWGSNRGGWRRDTLYVTDQNQIFALELGINGRDRPVDLTPQ
jgi:sugar lactone lactonase YvrE